MVGARFIDPSSRTFFGVNNQITSMDFEEVLPQQKSLELMVLPQRVHGQRHGQRPPQRYTGVYTTPNFLRILGISPALGRDFTADDNTAGAEKVALIGYGIWQRDFNGAQDIVGKAVRINGTPATIIGVMPRGSRFRLTKRLAAALL